MRPWAPCGRLRESRSGRREAVPRHRQTAPRRCTAGSTPARAGWPRPWPHCDPAPGHPGTADNASIPAVLPAALPAAMFPVTPSGLPLLLLSVTERHALLPEAVTPASYAWVRDLHATKTSRARRHPKVPVPVESWAAAEGTKVPLCQCPAGQQTQGRRATLRPRGGGETAAGRGRARVCKRGRTGGTVTLRGGLRAAEGRRS